MVASGVGQFSVNVKHNLREFYGELAKSKQTLNDLTKKKYKLELESDQLLKLRDRAQRLNAEMRELRQQKNEIKLGMKGDDAIQDVKKKIQSVEHSIKYLNATKLRIQSDPSSVENSKAVLKSIERKIKRLQSNKLVLEADLKGVDNTKEQLKNLDKSIASLNRQKLEVEAEIQPIRTANVELHKVEQEINRINNQKVNIDFKVKGIEIAQKGFKTISEMSSKLSGHLDKIGDKLGKVSAISLTPVALGLNRAVEYSKDFVKSTVDYSMEVEQAKATLRAQGVEGKKLKSTFSEIVDFANISPFDVSNMTQSVSLLNAYVGNIEKSVKATKVFGTSLYAAGRDASDLQRVATNLGELNTGNFTKTDYKELVKGVPTVSQALREIGVHNWNEFTEALGDNPDTKEIEITKNALDFVTNALEKYNQKTNALEESNKSLKAKLENTTGQFETMRDEVLNSSGAYEEIKKIIDAFSNQLTSDETKEALTKLFKGALPYLKELEKRINNFSLNHFIEDVKKGWKTVKDTLKETKQTIEKYLDFGERLPFIGNIIAQLRGEFSGNEKSLAEIVADFISNGIKLGMAGVNFKLASKGVSIFSFVTGFISTGIGASGKITEFIRKRISTEVRDGIENGVTEGMAQVSFSKKVNAGGKIGKGLGIANKTVGIAAKAGFAFEGLRIIDEVRNTIKVYNLKKIIELYKELPKKYPDLAERIKALKEFSDGIAKVSLYTKGERITNVVVDAIGGVGAGLSGVPAIGAVAAGVSLGAVLFKGMQIIDDIRENLKIDKIKSIISLAKDLQDIDFTLLANSHIGEKMSSLTKVLAEVYSGTKLKTMVDLGSSKGHYTFGEVVEQLYQTLPDEKKVEKIAKVIENAKKSASYLNNIGDIGELKNIASGIKNLKQGLFDLSEALAEGKQDKKVEFGPQLYPSLLPSTFKQTDSFKVLVEQVNAIFGEDFEENFNKLSSSLENIMKIEELLEPVESISRLKKIGESLGNLKANLKEVFVSVGESSIGGNGKHVIGPEFTDEKVSLSKQIESLAYQLGGSNEKVRSIVKFFEGISQLKVELEKLQDKKLQDEVIMENINVVKKAINSLKEVAGVDIENNLTGLSKALDSMVSSISAKYPPEFQKLGQLLARKLNNKYKETLDLQTPLASKIRSLKTDGMDTIGKNLATVLNNVFKDKLNIGAQINEAITDALSSNYKAKINLEVIETVKREDSKKQGKKPGKGHNAHGGLMINPYGTEVVDSPEHPVLQNGEYVIPKKIVNALGVPFFDRLRNGQISRTFAGLGQKVSQTTSSVVNNVYNNTTTQNMNVYPSGHQDMITISNRRLRV